MGRLWAMGVSASNCATDLAANAKAHDEMRKALIAKEAENRGISVEEYQSHVDGARRRLKLIGADRSPSYVEHGVAAPVMVKGENYQTVGVERDRNGDQIREVVRPLGGGRFATRRIRECVDGGPYTRVVAEARGG